jgi:hypothetical protein
VRVTILALLALTLAAAPARGVVTVQPERVTVVGPVPYDQTVSLEVFATNSDAAEDERLNAYAIRLEAPAFTSNGVRFVIPPNLLFQEPTTHPYVFRAYAGHGPSDAAGLSDFDTVFVSTEAPGTQDVNISETLDGLVRVQVFIPANTVGSFPIRLDPAFLSLGSGGPGIVAVLGTGYVQVGPEPGCLGELAVAGLLMLRRRPGIGDRRS